MKFGGVPGWVLLAACPSLRTAARVVGMGRKALPKAGVFGAALAFSWVTPSSADPGLPVVEIVGGLHDDNVSALAWGDGTLWVGTFDAGLARWDDARWGEITVDGGPKRRWVNALCWDGEDLWVGSAGGLARWSAASRRLEPVGEVDGAVQSIRGDGGALVVAGSDRVWVRDGDSWRTVELPGESLHAAFAAGDVLWTGGMWGALERRGEDWRRYSELNGRLPHSWVTALLAVGDEVWAGTYDAGLVALSDGGPARILRRDAWVNFGALTPTRDGVAVGTMEDGLLLWSRSSRSWRRLTSSDGLPSDDVTAIVEVGETLWVGTRDGVAAVR